MGVLQMEPVVFGTPEDDEDERARREAMATIAAAPLDSIRVPDPLRAQQAEATAVGDAMRARGPVEPPPNTTTYEMSEVLGSNAYRVRPVEAQRDPVQIEPVEIPRAPAPASAPPSLGRALGNPSGPSAAPTRSTPAPAPASPTPAPRGGLASQLGDPGRARARDLITRRNATKKAAPSPEAAPVDHTGADVADAIRRPLHALGAGLAAAARRPVSEFRSLGEESRRREREARAARLLEARQASQQAGQDRAARLAERRLAAQESEATARREDAEATRADRRAANESLASYRDRVAGIRQDEATARIGANEALARQRSTAADTEVALHDPASEMSQAARARLSDELAYMSQITGQPITPPDGIESYSAADVQRFEARIGVPRHTGGRRTGRGGGVRLSAPEGWSEADWRQLTRSQRGQVLRDVHSGEGGEGDGVELLPGVYGAGYVSTPEARAFRQHFAQYGAASDSIGELNRVYREHGASAAIDPRIARSIAIQLMNLRGVATDIQRTGTINEGEVETINAALPDPTNLTNMTIGDVEASTRQWQRAFRSMLGRELQSLGVNDAGINAAMRQLRRRIGGGSQARPSEEEGIRLTLPSGRTTHPLTPEQAAQVRERFPGAREARR